MTQIILDINNCTECPHHKRSRVYTEDSFEHIEEWFCKKADRKISGYVEWRDNVAIPNWCPLEVKNENMENQ